MKLIYDFRFGAHTQEESFATELFHFPFDLCFRDAGCRIRRPLRRLEMELP